MISVFEEIETLPSTQVESAMGDRECEAGSDQDIFHMCGHIVCSLKGMHEVNPAVRDEVAQEMLDILAHLTVVVFPQCQRS